MKAFKTPVSQHNATEIRRAAARASSLLHRRAVPDGTGAPSSLPLTCSRTFGLFPYIVIMNTATKHIHAQVFCADVFSFLLGENLGVELIGWRVGARWIL